MDYADKIAERVSEEFPNFYPEEDRRVLWLMARAAREGYALGFSAGASR